MTNFLACFHTEASSIKETSSGFLLDAKLNAGEYFDGSISMNEYQKASFISNLKELKINDEFPPGVHFKLSSQDEVIYGIY
jgi:hypothetical protein